MSRLPPVAGELIDRSRSVEFRFEGQPCSGFAGDTISSALAASGVKVFGRSFKYHRPRGLLSAANHDVNALVQVRLEQRSVPNVRADVVPVQDGWDIRAVNTRGSLRADRLSMLDHLGRSCRWVSTTRRSTASACFRAGSACSATSRASAASICPRRVS